jgi:hypothetical protein
MTKKEKEIRLYISSCEDVRKEITGISTLIRDLERDYFSKVSISNSTVCCEENNLVIELQCPMELHEVLYHMQQGNWGSRGPNLVQTGLPLLNLHMQSIREQNATFIDVEELSFQLKNCSIIIKKIAPESVENQLDIILSTLAENYVHITRDLSATPTEVFIPVYEEMETEDAMVRQVGPTDINDAGYFLYWGLYFETEEEALIYDLRNKKIIPGDLNLLEH